MITNNLLEKLDSIVSEAVNANSQTEGLREPMASMSPLEKVRLMRTLSGPKARELSRQVVRVLDAMYAVAVQAGYAFRPAGDVQGFTWEKDGQTKGGFAELTEAVIDSYLAVNLSTNNLSTN